MDLCCYGCKQPATYTFKNGKKCCSTSRSGCPVYKDKQRITNQKMTGMKKNVSFKVCPNCEKEIATNNFKKHLNWCNGEGKDKKFCVECGSVFYSFDDIKTCSSKCRNSLLSRLVSEQYASGKKKPFGGNGCRKSVSTSIGNLTVLSSYEAEACIIFDSWLAANKILRWEYTVDTFKYLDENGIERTYFPDFKITKLDGEFYYLETKGFQTIRDTFKWNSVKQQGFDIEVWFKDDIDQHKDNKD